MMPYPPENFHERRMLNRKPYVKTPAALVLRKQRRAKTSAARQERREWKAIAAMS